MIMSNYGVQSGRHQWKTFRNLIFTTGGIKGDDDERVLMPLKFKLQPLAQLSTVIAFSLSLSHQHRLKLQQ